MKSGRRGTIGGKNPKKIMFFQKNFPKTLDKWAIVVI